MSDNTGNIILWGMDETLHGNEEVIIACMPIIKSLDDGRIAVVRELGWNFHSASGLFFITYEEEASQIGTYLDLKKKIFINENEIVALMGSKFYSQLKDITEKDIFKSLMIDWISLEDGFFIKCMSDEEYELFTWKVADISKKVFDIEVKKITDYQITNIAVSALSLMDGNGAIKSEERYIRKLASAVIEKNTDDFISYLEFASMDLSEAKGDIERWLRIYLGIHLNKNLSDLGDIFKPLDIQESLSESTAIAQLSAPLMLSSPIKNYIQKNFSDIDNFKRLIESILEKTLVLNKKEAEREISLLCNLIASFESLGELSENLFRDAWIEVYKKYSSLNVNGDFAYRMAYLMKYRTENLIEYNTNKRISSKYKEKFKDRKLDWAEILHIFERVKDKAEEVKYKAGDLYLSSLTVGESQFHEDRIFSEVLDIVMRMVNGIRIEKHYIKYGKRHGVDFLLVNDFALTEEEKQEFSEIFYHKGYFAFTTQKHLQELRSNGVPHYVKKIIDNLLISNLSSNEANHLNHLNREKDIAARSWILIKSGFKKYPNSEYEQLYQDIKSMADTIEKLDSHKVEIPHISFDDDFENFICGKSVVFMGGSNHARLIKRWWEPTGKFIEVLNPSHLYKILKEKWPANRLIFKRNFYKESRKTEPLRKGLNELYQGIGNLLYTITIQSREDEASSLFLQYLMSKIASSQKEFESSRWSFVSHEDDMRALILEDEEINF